MLQNTANVRIETKEWDVDAMLYHNHFPQCICCCTFPFDTHRLHNIANLRQPGLVNPIHEMLFILQPPLSLRSHSLSRLEKTMIYHPPGPVLAVS
ncbi:hypothetical protein VTK73DRAFT_8350 [Phialemonium thermophilum]|uniref:Uncharacterized protein n=1 Tax=Phialemonium thermophilum TaxID=223376 RepID=A0ABR3Y700_9PEZI